jgi:PPK2 family polyphosphate:nucleotide phosphotransferase
VAKKKGARLSDFQYAGAATATTPLAPKAAKRFDLDRFDPGAKPFSSGSKSSDLASIDALATDIDRLQDLFYADRRFKLLVVLQGTDTSGKDGTIRGVFSKTSALGVKTAAWKAPSEEERAHDYLWRIHQKVPAAGEIVIFNRSHYEDVLVPVVKGWITRDETVRRFAQINDFERLLVETGTVIVKFLLHISKAEQRLRLQDRLDDPTKHWKFAVGDLEERTRWDDYQAAYSAAVAATGTPWAPWTIVPADSKTHRNLMIATAVKQTLQGLKLCYPPGDPALAGLKVT